MRYEAIYLAPHLDDVALSCGGQVYQLTSAGYSVLIVTITAGDPAAVSLSSFAQSLHDRWRLPPEAVVAGRRMEDAAACAVLGADYQHWDGLDAIYRRHPHTGEFFYPSGEAIFGPLSAAEKELVETMAHRLAQLPPAGRVVAPLTVGGHVDHQLTRRAAERCFGDSLLYYEDYPYAQMPGALETVVKGEGSWRPVVVPLTTAALQAKYQAIACYQSQLSTFFRDAADLEAQVGGYAQQVGGERLWQRRPH
ncbi:MAG: PIG-L family deacetylase [Chloroflexota bacterium]